MNIDCASHAEKIFHGSSIGSLQTRFFDTTTLSAMHLNRHLIFVKISNSKNVYDDNTKVN